jgi:hypothetical protein
MDDYLKSLRRSCATKLQSLALPVPFKLDVFCSTLARERGRSIHLRAFLGHGDPYGLWASGPFDDYLFYQGGTSPLHQFHIILHELSHLILGHQPPMLPESEVLKLLCPDLTQEALRHILLRAGYSDRDEQAAEMLATLLLARIDLRSLPSDTSTPDALTHAVNQRLTDSLAMSSPGAE